MAITPYMPDSELLGRRRFPDNKGFRKELQGDTTNVLSVMWGLMPSNYPRDPSTNLSMWNTTVAREVSRANYSMNAINGDKQYTDTRIKFLQQILGERLFLTERIAPAGYNDETYRNYLQSVKDAYLKGSQKSTIEALASEFTGLTVKIKELYLEARKPNSSYGVQDGNKMIVDVFIDDALRAGYNINLLKSDLDFFINLTKPAHVLYDMGLIWTDIYNANKVHDIIFGDTGGGCVPSYDYDLFTEPTVKANLIFILNSPTGATGQIDAVHYNDLLFFLDDATRILTEPGLYGTAIFDPAGKRVDFTELEVGQYVRVIGVPVPGSFQFWWLPDFLVGANFWEQFYRTSYQSSAFQEFVKKQMDSKGRFPKTIRTTPTTLCDRWVEDALQPLYEDLRSTCAGVQRNGRFSSELMLHMRNPRWALPYPKDTVFDQALFGSDYIDFMPNSPLTDGSSNPAMPADVTILFDGTSNYPSAVDASSARITTPESQPWWDSSFGRLPIPGDVLTYGYHFLGTDSTNHDGSYAAVFGIAHWQMPQTPMLNGDGSGTLAGIADVTLTVDGTVIPDAVTAIDPLLGHVLVSDSSVFWADSTLGRIPVIGDTFGFAYLWGERYIYSALFDDIARPMDTWKGSTSTYGLVMDVDQPSGDPETEAVIPDSPVEIGYRYRAFLLHHSSVLNSPDTLNYNDFQKPANRASLANQCQTLNHLNPFFSAEFLYDKNPYVLNDPYLDNGLDPVVKLRQGTPTFQQTFGYQPRLVEERKLQDIRTNRHPLMYSDLLLKKFPDGGAEVPLTPICEGRVFGTDTIRADFSVRLGEDEVPPLEECEPWELFDTFGPKYETVTIPGGYIGVPNLRIPDKKLRQNFILRELQPSGIASFSYTVTTTVDTATNMFQLPASFPITLDNGDVVDFAALPVMKDRTTLAGPADIQVTVDGNPWTAVSLDPLTGQVTLTPFPELKKTEVQYVLTEDDVRRSYAFLPGIPLEPANTTLTVIHGSAQYYGFDYYVYGRTLSWYGTFLDGLFEAGDIIRISFDVNPVVAATIVFTYKILSTATVAVPDPGLSRLMDNDDVFPGYCKDGPSLSSVALFREWFTFLSDYSEGIKVTYFNKATATQEDHVFSGPVFETWDAGDDEIGVPDSNPRALVRLRRPTATGNPLTSWVDYDFMGDALVRFRKKTFQELLPDRTFRTLKITEMLPV